MLNVSVHTHRAEFGMPAGCLYSEISDYHLDQLVSEILQVCARDFHLMRLGFIITIPDLSNSCTSNGHREEAFV